MKIKMLPLKALGRVPWPKYFWHVLELMPEVEIDDSMELQHYMSPEVHDLFKHEEEELLALAGVSREEWPRLVEESGCSPKELFWKLELEPVTRNRNRQTALSCPTQFGKLNHAQYTLQLQVDGKKVAINTREYSMFNRYGAEEFDLVLDCQYDPKRQWPSNVVPFVMFGNDMPNLCQQMDHYRSIVQAGKKKYRAGWHGRWWMMRRRFLHQLQGHDQIYIADPRDSKQLTYEEYTRLVSTWQWGLVLSGKGSNPDGSYNQREYEFSALGVPMVLNYSPTYYVPFEDGVHFRRIESSRDVIELVESQDDGSEIAANAREYWQQHMSIAGIQRLFRRICQEQL